MEKFILRTIEAGDDAPLAMIIRNALAEFKADKPGTVYYDPTTDHLFELFQSPGSIYWVAVLDEKLVGGAGIYPTDGLGADTCELVKLYLSPAARGHGLGKALVARCLESAATIGYKKVYLETMPELTVAIPMYEKMGFTYLDAAMGNSGHSGCDVWMVKNI